MQDRERLDPYNAWDTIGDPLPGETYDHMSAKLHQAREAASARSLQSDDDDSQHWLKRIKMPGEARVDHKESDDDEDDSDLDEVPGADAMRFEDALPAGAMLPEALR